MGSEGLQQTFEALLNSLAIAESSLEKCVHQSCALPGHPAAQVLYFRFSIFFFFPVKQAVRPTSSSVPHESQCQEQAG